MLRRDVEMKVGSHTMKVGSRLCDSGGGWIPTQANSSVCALHQGDSEGRRGVLSWYLKPPGKGVSSVGSPAICCPALQVDFLKDSFVFI